MNWTRLPFENAFIKFESSSKLSQVLAKRIWCVSANRPSGKICLPLWWIQIDDVVLVVWSKSSVLPTHLKSELERRPWPLQRSNAPKKDMLYTTWYLGFFFNGALISSPPSFRISIASNFYTPSAMYEQHPVSPNWLVLSRYISLDMKELCTRLKRVEKEMRPLCPIWAERQMSFFLDVDWVAFRGRTKVTFDALLFIQVLPQSAQLCEKLLKKCTTSKTKKRLGKES